MWYVPMQATPPWLVRKDVTDSSSRGVRAKLEEEMQCKLSVAVGCQASHHNTHIGINLGMVQRRQVVHD